MEGLLEGFFWWHWGTPKCLGSGKWHVESESISLVILLRAEPGMGWVGLGSGSDWDPAMVTDLASAGWTAVPTQPLWSCISVVQGLYRCWWMSDSHRGARVLAAR